MSATPGSATGTVLTPPAPHVLALAVLGVVLALWLGALAVALTASVLPDETDGTVAVVFAPGTREAAMYDTVLAAGGSLLRDTRLRTVWVVHGVGAGFAGRLRAAGAWQVFAPIAFDVVTLPGCVSVLPEHRGD